MIQFREMIAGQTASFSDAGQSLEVLTQPIISNKSKKTERHTNQPRRALGTLVTRWFYFQPSTLFIPFFIIHLSLLAALYPAEQQEVRVRIITIFIQTISYVASLSSFCPWSP